VYFKSNPKEKTLLDPGEKAVLRTEENLISKSVNIDPNYMAWKTRVLVFDNETLANVVNTLQNVYQTPVILANPALAECRVTVSFEGQSLQSVIEVIKKTLDLQVKQNGKTIELSGKSCR
jgi:ferric-dicitrate binding protein FerR (iron transport regulator)